ncbi:hypothetical protein LTR37_014105 [Vermiconidia calcicola]|uniref:Uncharacterized protein n=1 Tax=Vermiconidia calcicola TaxID=1690605 RepID=A0ACC3MUG5_9PEZI|nr:hypothetical protein LTR37_014105 [Vermiconidia calcicola]
MWTTVVLVTCFFVVVRIIQAFVAKRRLQTFAQQHGCEEPEDVTGPFPYGVNRLRRMLTLATSGEDILDDIIGSDFTNAATVKFSGFDGNTAISTTEPANLQAILATQFKEFVGGDRRYHCFKPAIGHSIFNADGAFWEHSRALFRPQFSRENINDLEMTDKASNSLITAIGSADASGWTANQEMMPLIYNFTLDTATDFLFGETVGSQQLAIAARTGQTGTYSSDDDAQAKGVEAQAFARSFAIVQDYIVMRIRLQSLWWLGDGFEFRKATRTIRKFTDRFVQLAINTAASPSKGEGKNQSLMNSLATQTQDRKELQDQTLSILLAGRDTTASMLGWCLVRLAIHPEVFNKLRGIVLENFEPDEPITFVKLKDCRYLQHFLNEVLRLHPTVPLNSRNAAKDTTIPVGCGSDQKSPVVVRKGQVVLFCVYLMHRREDLWGEDALKFKPERWQHRIPAWQYLPFLGGPRICLGQQFALTETSYLLVRLLQQYDAMEPVHWDEMQKLKKGLGVTMWPQDGARVRFHKATAYQGTIANCI